MYETRVLLIDDDEMISGMVKRILIRNEYKVISCYNLSDAQSIIDENSPNIVIVSMDSFKAEIIPFLMENKKRQNHSKYIVISSTDNEVEILKAGADDWIRKPYKSNVLLTRLEVMCRDN